MALRTESPQILPWEQSLLNDLNKHLFSKDSIRSGLLSESCGIHLAIFREPYLGYILEGKKTVESRFSSNRCAPYKKVQRGDIILLKQTSGPIVAACKVDYVWNYQIDESSMANIRSEFTQMLCAQDPSFWEVRRHARFATLMLVNNVVSIDPIECNKRDRRGWVVLQETPTLPFSLESN